MNDETSAPRPSRAPQADAICESCGRYGAFEIAGRLLCDACYAEAGSCCLEFGKDDLWPGVEFSISRQRDADDRAAAGASGEESRVKGE